ncbi:hypothetical protein P280DRAFT_85678 [Massarina eburnea CBS 473.64]|uniref:Uncharacterized protein n=1 Tax=Massarina eburnea CBS 473.64 TaxID=1395130 RepID=A0A6A6RT92_9PLEO|nr:hypothetical protein P280DRAFT_85678 [Massarina eburnea CBS 473.64]
MTEAQDLQLEYMFLTLLCRGQGPISTMATSMLECLRVYMPYSLLRALSGLVLGTPLYYPLRVLDDMPRPSAGASGSGLEPTGTLLASPWLFVWNIGGFSQWSTAKNCGSYSPPGTGEWLMRLPGSPLDSVGSRDRAARANQQPQTRIRL